MQLTDDMELLREYATRGSEPAFETLVQRHVNLVYSAAFRCVRDRVLAGEVTQTVFIILAKKAHSLRPGTILSGWLYRTAQLAAGHALRAACRRRKHEEEAAPMLHQETEPPDSTWEQIAPFLEEAMARLGEDDRNVIVLRYFDNKDFKTVGAALGATENTVQKRTARAIEKLRAFLAKRGVMMPAIMVTAALSAHAVQAAPAGMAASAAAASLTGTTATSSIATLLKGTLKLMAWTKLKTTVVVGVVALLATGTTFTAIKMIRPSDYYSWEVENPTGAILNKARPQVSLLPTKFGSKRSWVVYWEGNGKAFGIGVPAKDVIECAFRQLNNTRTRVDVHLPKGRYDFISSLSKDASNGLCKAITSKFGVTASHQMIATNVLVLSVNNPNADGLKPPREGDPKTAPGKSGHHASNSETIKSLTRWLEGRVHVPVVDQTGLTGKYAYSLDWDEPDAKQHNDEGLKQALIQQLGLELTPDIQPVDILVIAKSK